MTRAILSAVAVCLLIAACSTGQPHLFKPLPGGQTPAGDGLLSATLLRGASGAPSGVRVSWEAVPDVAGYNLYRMATAIPDSEVGSTVNRVNATLIPAVPATGTVSFDDLFPTNVGDSWYYRVSSVDADGDESELSPESSLVITDFIVTQLVTTAAGVGDPVEIIGENFGSYDPATDKVFFPGVTFTPGVGFEPDMIEATILEHEINRIRCTVPTGATTGQVLVQNNGLSQNTPEDFTNTDPYIESISPIHGTTDDQVTLTGNNFGTSGQVSLTLRMAGDTLPAVQIDSHAPTQIVFRPMALNGGASFGTERDLLVQVDGTPSNVARFTLDNRPPVASISASPPDAQTPATIELDASASVDPDNGDAVSYLWDFDGDGVFEFDSGTDPTVSHTFIRSGDFEVGVHVNDLSFASGEDTTTVHVSLSRLQLLDNGNFAPGSEFFEDSFPVQINFILQGGEPDYGIKWFLTDSNGVDYMLANDVAVPTGAQSRQFVIDTAMGTPQAGVDRIPAGTWRLRAETSDGGAGNDPDPIVSWPTFANGSPGTFTVYRYNAIVVQDEEGDRTASESSYIGAALSKLGYKTGTRSSKNLTLGDLTGADCVVWGLDGPYGNPGNPMDAFGALGTLDTTLMRQYLDGGGNLVLFAPPVGAGPESFLDRQFATSYQPFLVFRQQSSSPWNHDLHNFAADGDHTLAGFSTTGAWGEDAHADLLPGSTALGDYVEQGNGFTYHTLASRESSGGGTCVFGMFVFSKVGGVTPPGSTPDWLLDNLVVGAVEN